MIERLEELATNLNGKEILITNTFETDSLGYNLAHVLRTFAKKTWCVDPRYKMTKELEGYRIIESGKVILVRGDIITDRDEIYRIIQQLNGHIDYEIIIK